MSLVSKSEVKWRGQSRSRVDASGPSGLVAVPGRPLLVVHGGPGLPHNYLACIDCPDEREGRRLLGPARLRKFRMSVQT